MGVNRRGFLGLIFGSALFKAIGKFLPLPEINVPAVEEDDEVVTYTWHAAKDWIFEGRPTADRKGMHWVGKCSEYPTEVLQWVEYEGSASVLDWIRFRYE